MTFLINCFPFSIFLNLAFVWCILSDPGTVLEAVVNELAPSGLDGKLRLRTNGPKPNPRSADGGGDNHFSNNNNQLDPLGNPVGSYVSIAG